MSRGNPLRFLMHIPVPWVFILAYLVGVGLEFAYPSYTGTEPLHGISRAGGVLLAIGAAIAAWSLVLFFKARTTTVPGRKSCQLVTRGPYRFSRNPMYVGLVIAYLGEAGILKQAWPILFLPFIVGYLNWIVIPVEEARLTEVSARTTSSIGQECVVGSNASGSDFMMRPGTSRWEAVDCFLLQSPRG